jgi:hypothetical protein
MALYLLRLPSSRTIILEGAGNVAIDRMHGSCSEQILILHSIILSFDHSIIRSFETLHLKYSEVRVPPHLATGVTGCMIAGTVLRGCLRDKRDASIEPSSLHSVLTGSAQPSWYKKNPRLLPLMNVSGVLIGAGF